MSVPDFDPARPSGPGVTRRRVERLGSRGEGVIAGPNGPIFAPYALAGELVDVQGEAERAALIEVIEPSPDRIAAICPHFTQCGGCAVQTLAAAPYAAWKRGLVVAALAQAGVSTEVAPLIDAHGAGRRRATIHARTQGQGVGLRAQAGFMRARSHEVIDLPGCPILAPGMERAFDVARALVRALASLGKPLDVQATATENGLDVDLRGAGALTDALRRALIELAQELDLARLTHHGVITAERRPPTLSMGRARVVPPGGGFLQATALGEETLAGLAGAAVAGAKRVADLFCGCGAFTLRLAENADVFAADSDAAAVAALDKAMRTPGLRQVTAQARDLFRRPMTRDELGGFDAVVFDPPRAGAQAQAEQIALSPVPTVVAVSCHPGSFARDAKILIEGGYRIGAVTPVDQFRHSAHVELVAVFSKPRPKSAGKGKARGLFSR
jgi:23S rRNA (uracil1939-C5)-methyltransferase